MNQRLQAAPRRRGGVSQAVHKAAGGETPDGLDRVHPMNPPPDRPRAKTILLVEDEIFIRLWAAEELSDAGFEVIEAGHAQEALEVLVRSPEAFAVVFTDVQMPGVMDGIGLAHHATSHWPWIGVIIASARPKAHQPPIPDHWRFVDKPYSLDHVVRHISELMPA